jgi:hypothetical protein
MGCLIGLFAESLAKGKPDLITSAFDSNLPVLF